MRNKTLSAALLAPLLFAACTTLPEPPPKTAAKLSPLRKKLAEADRCADQKQWRKAFVIYSEAQKEIDDLKLHRAVQLKISRALCGMKNDPAALAALAPMPEFPATLNDCKKLAMASRILHRMKGKPDHVEALLEVALDNAIDEPGVIPFKAAGYAELGRLYVAHRKTARAVKCFEYAAKLYRISGDREQAAACRNIMEYLK